MHKFLPPMLFAVLAFVMFGSHAWCRSSSGVWANAVCAEPLRGANSAGAVLAFVGLVLAGSARARFARARTNIHTFRRPEVLVTHGPFSVSRNPMYLGFALMLGGLAVALGSVITIAPVVAFVAITDRWYIQFEEQMMRDTFGAAYLDYSRRTRRWL